MTFALEYFDSIFLMRHCPICVFGILSNFMYSTLIVYILLCSWKHHLSWKSLVCPQKREQRMDTTHSWMTSRIPNFILVSPLTIPSRWSRDPIQVFSVTRTSHRLFVEIILCKLRGFQHFLVSEHKSNFQNDKCGYILSTGNFNFSWTSPFWSPRNCIIYLKDRTFLYRCKNQ